MACCFPESCPRLALVGIAFLGKWDLLLVLVVLRERQSRSQACLGERVQVLLLELLVDVKGGQDQVLAGLVKACHSASLPGQKPLEEPFRVSHAGRVGLVVDHQTSKAQGLRTAARVGRTVEQSAVDSQDLGARDRLSRGDLAWVRPRQGLGGDQDGVERRTKGVLLE